MGGVFKVFVFLFCATSLLAYVAAGILGIEEKIINLLFIVILFFSCLIFILIDSRFPKIKKGTTFYVIAIIYLFTWLISVLRNEPTEWIPSFLRYGSYLLLFALVYKYTILKKITRLFVTQVCVTMLLITALFGLKELMGGNVTFVNGAYRVHGNFLSHLGYGMMLFVTLNYLLNVEVIGRRIGLSLLFYLGVFLFGLYMMNSAQSRMLTVSILFVNILAYWLFSKNIANKIKVALISVILVVAGYYFVLNTEYFPRIREALVVDATDPSTLYRFFIINETFKAMKFIDYLVGIGMGGFNMFFYRATGELGVAAHNNYLLWLVEGGIGVFAMFIFFQIKFIIDTVSIRKRHSENKEIRKLAFATFSIFVGIEVFGFLLNPHYFYQVESFAVIVYGYFFGKSSALSMNVKKM